MNQVAAKKLASKGPIIDPKLVLKPASGALSDNTIGNTKYPERKGVNLPETPLNWRRRHPLESQSKTYQINFRKPSPNNTHSLCHFVQITKEAW